MLLVNSLEYHPEHLRVGQLRQSPLADTENIDYWMKRGLDELNKAKEEVKNENVAKNVIIFVGDGMSIPTVTAARVYKGQQEKKQEGKGLGAREGNSGSIHWENFPNMALSKTYSTTAMVPDSASTATAIFSGVKTTQWTLGYDSHIVSDDPESVANATPLTTMLDWAQQAGMKTGFISNTRMTHATPAALYAKSASRNWECDSKMPKNAKDLKDIARQMIENKPGRDTDIILGGGMAPFVDYDALKPNKTKLGVGFDYAEDYYNCHRNDGRNLLKEWSEMNANGRLVTDKSSLLKQETMTADKVLGLFSWSYMPYEYELTEEMDTPNLEEMTRTAVNYLQAKAGDAGFFLMVEGGRIDHAHHGSQAARALSETLGLERAVRAADELVNTKDTLIIVTADHSHTFSMGGYPDRFADITKEVAESADGPTLATDKAPFTIMGYANGDGFNGNTVNLAGDGIVRPAVPAESSDFEYKYPSGIPLKSETHGGDDVGIWATGPMSHLFHSVHEESYIAHVMAYAAAVGPYSDQDRERNNGGSVLVISFLTILSISLAHCLL